MRGDVATDDVVVVGRIGGPFGVQGWVHVHSFTDPPENLLDYRPWRLKGKYSDWQPVLELQCRPHKKGFIARFKDSLDRDAAAAFTGQLIGVPAPSLPALAEADEFYWRDLVGCVVVDGAGGDLGRVDHLLETGANDVLVVVSPHGEQILIPFVADYVTSVDAATRTITVDWDIRW